MVAKKRNSASLTIKAENIVPALQDLFASYHSEIVVVLDEAARETASQSVNELKRLSASKSGKYAKNWTFHQDKKGRMDNFGHTYVVHNEKTYRLTHLLESGHEIVNTRSNKPVKSKKKKSKADGVIDRVESWANDYYV